MIKLFKMECPSCGGVLKKKGFSTYNCPFCGMDYKLDMDIIVPVGDGTKQNNGITTEHANNLQNRRAFKRSVAIACLVIIALVVIVAIILGNKSESSINKPTAAGVKVTPAAKGLQSSYFQQLAAAIFEKDYSLVTEEELAQVSYLDMHTDSRNVKYRLPEGELKTVEIVYEGRIKYEDLKYFTGLKGLKFGAYRDYNYVLSGMTELEELTCEFSPEMVLKTLPNPEKLRSLSCDYSDGTVGEISRFTNLEKLSLTYYSTSLAKEQTPDLSEIGRLTGLTEIYLNMKEDYMVFPFMSSLTNLKSVNIHCDTLKDISFLENMPDLESLTLVDCDILNIDSLKSVPKLRTLRLEDCYKVESYDIIPTLTELEELMLSYYHNQKVPEDFSSLKKVKRLILGGFQDISFLEQFPNVEYLRLYGCNYSKFGNAACMKNLKELKLGGGTGLYGLDFLTKMDKLEKVDFSGLEAGTDTEKLFNIPNLKELDLSRTGFAMDLNLVEKNESLEVLYLENLSWKAYNDVTYTGERRYNFKDWDKLPMTECLSFLENFPNLRILSLEGNKIEGIDFLQKLNKLESLNLTNNYIKDLTVINSLPALKELSCGENSLTTQNVNSGVRVNYASKAKKTDPFNHYDW